MSDICCAVRSHSGCNCLLHPFHFLSLSPSVFLSAQFFGAVVTLAYGVSALFSYLDWRGDGGNAATSTVPT